MHTITIRRPDDFHVHFRTGEMMRMVVPLTAAWCGRALVMPNTIPPILTATDAIAYSDEIKRAAGDNDFKPLMTIKIVPTTTPTTVENAKKVGVIAGKVYPVGVTTNSDDGVHNFHDSGMIDVFSAMREAGMVLCLHGETPGDFCLDREEKFLDTLRWLAETFPGLKIVLEHITTAAGIEAVEQLPDAVAGTITVHHLLLTLNDVIGDKLSPHHFCKPVAKRPEDRGKIRAAAMNGSNKFFLGTDSAPHDITTKECASGCAGVFTAPVALPLLAGFFQQHERHQFFEFFTSIVGAQFYGLPFNTKTITLEENPWVVPPNYSAEGQTVVPFWSGKELRWRVA